MRPPAGRKSARTAFADPEPRVGEAGELSAAAAADLAALQPGVRQLSDEQLQRVVAMVDTLSERGALDSLLAPLRFRLAKLKPPRKPTLNRVLFIPVEPLIVPPTAWVRGELSFVRSALGPLARLVFQGMGAEAVRLRRHAEACQPGDEASILAIGAKLWPTAANILRDAEPPANWTGTGLAAPDFALISHDLSTLLSVAVPVETLIRQARLTGDVAEPPLVDLLVTAARQGGSGFGMLSLLLMARLPNINMALRATRRVAEMSENAKLGTVADFVLDHGLGCIQNTADQVIKPETPVAKVADGLEQLRSELAEVEVSPQAQRTDRRRRITGLRQQIDQGARDRFAGSLEDEVLGPMLSGAAGDTVSPEELEARVRALRRLGEAGGSFGDPRRYDEMLRRAVVKVCEMKDTAHLTLVDRVRLVEVLMDSDTAMELLTGRKRPS